MICTDEWPCLNSFEWAPLSCSERGDNKKFKMKIYVWNPAGDIYFHFKFLAPFRSEQLSGANAKMKSSMTIHLLVKVV